MSKSLRLAVVVSFLAVALSAVAPARALPHADKTPLPPKRPVRYSAQVTTPLFPYTDTFKLHSLPGAQRVIYLDFNGETVSNSAWNDQYTNGSSFYASPFDTDGNSSSFSNGEMDAIQGAWARVAEDYAPLAVDVTTEDPTLAMIDRSGASDALFGTRALITNTSTIYSGCSCSGVAYVGTFGVTSNHQYYEPALIFNNALYGYDKDLGDTIAHEVGHNLGLDHDGNATSGYDFGHGDWAPIMGAGFYHPITQFSKGEYANANNQQDDFAVMQQNGVPLRADDFGNTTATAASFPSSGSVKGIISTDADVDVFSVSAADGPVTFSATPSAKGPNLDIKLELLNAGGSVIGSDDPPSAQPSNEDSVTGLAASVSTTVTAGTYYLRVQGVGSGDPVTNGYSGYGSVGQYTVTGTTATGQVPSVPTVSIKNVAVNEGDSGTTNVVFTATLSAASASAVSVNYATSNSTATAGVDYAAASGTITIPAGQTSATFTVVANGDTTPETDEKFSVTLSNAVGATILTGTAAGTLINDDGIGISIANVTRYEGTSTTGNTFYKFTITLSNAPVSTIGATATTANGTAIAGGSDYWYKAQNISFAPGQKTATFTVSVRGDAVTETNELFYVNLTNPTGTGAKITDGRGNGKIVNDD